MKIIIEGADMTGKTTLVKRLAKDFNLSIMHINSKDPNDLPFYYQLLRKENVVYDRHFIGEMIYPKVFNRKQNLDEFTFIELLEIAKNKNVCILVLHATEEDLIERLKQRPNEPKEVVENLFSINQQFYDIATKHHIPIIDVTKVSYEQILDIINKTTRRI